MSDYLCLAICGVFLFCLGAKDKQKINIMLDMSFIIVACEGICLFVCYQAAEITLRLISIASLLLPLSKILCFNLCINAFFSMLIAISLPAVTLVGLNILYMMNDIFRKQIQFL